MVRFQKYGFAWTVFFALINGLHAQIVDSTVVVHQKPETLLRRINIQNITQNGFNIWKDKFTGHWAGIDLGFNFLTFADYSEYNSEFLKNKIAGSSTFIFNPVQQSIGFQRNKNTIGMVTGLGLEWKSYLLDKNTTFEKDESGKIVPRTLFFEDNQKSRFSLTYLTFPLLLEFQIPVNHYKNRAFISFGFLGGIRLTSFTKIIYRLERKREKLKTPGDFSLHNFRSDISMRFGYRNIQFFGNYDVVPMFKKDLGPRLFPLTIGMTLLSF